MYLAGEIGCGLLLYAPYVIACAHAAHVAPQLLCVWLGSAALAYLPLFCMALLFVDIRRRADAGAALATCARLVFVLLAVLTQFIARLATHYGWYALHRHLQRVSPSHQALFCSSRYLFLPVSLAVGLAFGFVSMLVNAGTFFDAGRQILHYTHGTTAYDLYACPLLPSLVHRSLQSFLLTVCQAAWAMMSGQALIALSLYGGPRKYMRLLYERWRGAGAHGEEAQLLHISSDSDHNSITPRDEREDSVGHERQEVEEQAAGEQSDAEDKGNIHSTTNDATLPPVQEIHLTREEREGNAAVLAEDQQQQQQQQRSMMHTLIHTAHTKPGAPDTPLSCAVQDTNLVAHIDLALALLVLSFLLQLIFSLLSLLHARPLFTSSSSSISSSGGEEGVVDDDDEMSAGYTCAVSLPLQLVVTIVSLLLALCVVQAEQSE